MIDIDRMTNDSTYEHYAYAPRVPLYQRRPLVTVILTLALIVAAAIVLCAVFAPKPVKANDVMTYLTGNGSGWSVCNGGVCVWGNGSLPSPNIRNIPQPELQEDKDAVAARDRDWAKACDPKPVRDRYGVMRYQYAKEGCEFGSPR
jgi:hypothetical protein